MAKSRVKVGPTRSDGDRDGDPLRCEKCGEVHERCAAHRKGTVTPCMGKPVRGSAVCRMHGASAPAPRRKARQRVAIAAAVREVGRLGGSLDVDPLDALLGLVREAAANVEVYRRLAAGLEAAVGEPDERVVAIGEQVIYGEKSASHVPAAPHIFVAMYDSERDRLARYAKLCLDAGIDDRRVRLAEAQGAAMAGVIQAAVAAAIGSLERGVGKAIKPERLRALVEAAQHDAVQAADAALMALDAPSGIGG